jgi:RNA polymerase sigma factor (sigma-70 family)
MGTGAPAGPSEELDLQALLPIVQRVVGARVADPTTAEDLVQETLLRVLAAVDRIEPGMLEPYAISTAKNVVITLWRDQDRQRRNLPRAVDPDIPEEPGDELEAREEQTAVARALLQLSEEEQETLLAHEVSGRDTRALADERGLTPGAVAARLNRTRARMRVEYLLALEGVEPPTDRCRPVLLALSLGDRRRQREAGTDGHLLECAMCERLSGPLLERGVPRDDEVRVPINAEGDVVAARQAARDIGRRVGLPPTGLTAVVTAVSEAAHNIVRFAGCGEVVVEVLDEPRPGLRVVARDNGPGIPDVDRAVEEVHSSDSGLGLGLPGIQQLMDECTVVSRPGCGTTVTMTKWCTPDAQ